MNVSPQKPVIVFDLGGVLIDWNPRYLYRKLFDNHQDMEYFLTEVCSPEWNMQQDAGRSFADAVAALEQHHAKWRSYIEAYFARWDEMLGGAIQGAVDVLEKVKGLSVPLYALSNWSAETFHFAQQRFEFLDWFDHIVLSGWEKTAKPQPTIYNILMQHAKAADYVFIDDVSANLQTANDLGWQTILYESPTQLQQALQQQLSHYNLSF